MNPHLPKFRATALSVVAAAAVLAGCSSSSNSTPTTAPPSSTTTTAALVKCPLTGTPAPGGVIPARPAIAMKVDNYLSARPQTGLNLADIVFEEQVEGVITRYAAVFQCNQAPLVGPIRSARQIDIGILSQLGAPLLVHVGGITPVLDNINNSALINVDLATHPSAEINPPGRYAPYDTYTTTSDIWGLYPKDTTAPLPIFQYSTTLPPGLPLTSARLNWSYNSDITWHWNPTTGTFQRYYNVSQPDLLANGTINQVQNVVVQVVHITYGPWVENSGGSLEVQAQIANSSGKAYVLRNGRITTGTWTHGAIGSPTVFLDHAGKVISLQPGRTWVEVYPDVAPVSVTRVTAAG